MSGNTLDRTISDVHNAYFDMCEGDCEKCNLPFCFSDTYHYLDQLRGMLKSIDNAKNGGDWR